MLSVGTCKHSDIWENIYENTSRRTKELNIKKIETL